MCGAAGIGKTSFIDLFIGQFNKEEYMNFIISTKKLQIEFLQVVLSKKEVNSFVAGMILKTSVILLMVLLPILNKINFMILVKFLLPL